LSIPDYTAGPPKVSAFPVFVAIGSFIARSGVTAGAIAGARWVGKNVLRKAWTAIAAGGWTGAGVAVGSFFAVDYVASKLQGEKAEIEKLYAAGRNIGGAVVESTTSIIHFLPALMIAAGVWFFLKQGKE
jgi:hypothetical protein